MDIVFYREIALGTSQRNETKRLSFTSPVEFLQLNHKRDNEAMIKAVGNIPTATRKDCSLLEGFIRGGDSRSALFERTHFLKNALDELKEINFQRFAVVGQLQHVQLSFRILYLKGI